MATTLRKDNKVQTEYYVERLRKQQEEHGCPTEVLPNPSDRRNAQQLSFDFMQDEVEKPEQERHDGQFDEVVDALCSLPDFYVPLSCIYEAALETASMDCPNKHQTPVRELLPKAVELANNRAEFTTSWDCGARWDDVVAEVNAVLRSHGLTLRETEWSDCDQIELELVRISHLSKPQFCEEAK